MSDIIQKAKIRGLIEIKKMYRKPQSFFYNPFLIPLSRKPLIVHCCQHKCGTVWFKRILLDLCAHFGLSFHHYSGKKIPNKIDVLFDDQIQLDFDVLPEYVGSHMIRDPRDILVSGYFYHLWTREKWANRPSSEFNGKSYREQMSLLSQSDGLLLEIVKSTNWMHIMTDWNYHNSRIFEIRYEDIIQDEYPIFKKLFTHFGFNKTAVEKACAIAQKYSFKRVAKRDSGVIKQHTHLRSGKSGEWKNCFNEEHKTLFKQLYPGLLEKLGYEKNDSW